ncbi:MAG: undecaprenyldiphospho-muramoylpentapeptide beta-N-acetylglucosaminyltransferase [bacterium]|jgi:UDP-N-acetylglucosamine--N-acetylmuramyl-(pentapeptide) pyrophosphoryl-undecaprenol N-acetylglucosamine transferase
MRIIITGGGTGGHVYPAIATADELRAKMDNPEILFVGTKSGLEADLVPKAGYRLATIVVSGVERRFSLKAFKALGAMMVGGWQAAALLRRFRPDVVIGTGGYVCGPVVLFAHLFGIPTLICEQNVIPGVTNRLLGRFADIVCVTYEASRRYFPARTRVVVTGNPIRREITLVSRAAGRRNLGIDPAQRVVFVVGGSVGAKKLNEAMTDVYRSFRKRRDITFIHVTGKDKYEGSLARLREIGIDIQSAGNIILKPYLYNVADAYAAADLIVCRAGGITLSEVTAVGLPAVLIPYPFATNNHQYHNARHLEQAGAAVLLSDDALSGAGLTDILDRLLSDPGELSAMGEKCRSLGHPKAVDEIAELALSLPKSLGGQ